MFNKVYEKIKQFMKENIKYILIFLIGYLVLTYPLPYYIYTGGGTININDRVEVADADDSQGSLHFAYVKELRGNVASFLLAQLMHWDMEKEEEMKLSEDDTSEDIAFRNHIYLENANQTAILLAYSKAGKKAMIKDRHFYVLYVENSDEANLQVGDEIISVDGKQMVDTSTYTDVVAQKEIGEQIEVGIIRDEKEMTVMARVQDIDGKKLTGVSITTIYEYETDPKLELHFKQSESGPSGGLMLTLAIYDKLVAEDITHGKKIVGTGTIASDGTVGEIGGVKYKLQGAVASKADIFLVPAGSNYEEAKAEQEKNHYDIVIQPVATFEEALDFLESLDDNT